MTYRTAFGQNLQKETKSFYRRNLQRAYIERLSYLMTESQTPATGWARTYGNQTRVLVNQSDIRSVVRGQLNKLKKDIEKE